MACFATPVGKHGHTPSRFSRNSKKGHICSGGAYSCEKVHKSALSHVFAIKLPRRMGSEHFYVNFTVS